MESGPAKLSNDGSCDTSKKEAKAAKLLVEKTPAMSDFGTEDDADEAVAGCTTF